MKIALSVETALATAAAMIAALGAALLLTPAPRRVVPPFAAPLPADAATTSERASKARPAEPQETAPSQSALLISSPPSPYAKLAAAFDLSALPAPVAPLPPPPDPAAELKRYRFVGSAAAGERQRALFDAGGDVRALGVGDALADFVLTRIDPGAAVFVKDAIEVRLPLHAPP